MRGVPSDPARREERKRKISEAMRGKIPWSKGKHLSEKTRRKISEAMGGKPKSEEHRRKISESHKRENLSEETIRKMSEARKGRQHSEETRRKMSDAHKGKPLSEETKRKFSGENNYAWKGDSVGFNALHEWVNKYKPRSQTGCEHCHKNKPLHAANVSGKYRRDINDYLWLCPSCHRKFDIANNTHCKNLLVTLEAVP